MKKTLSLLLILAAAAFAQFPGPPASYPAVDSDTLNAGSKMLWQLPPFTGTAKLRSMTYAELQSGSGGASGQSIHDSLVANGIGDSATRVINAKAFIGNGTASRYVCYGNSLCLSTYNWYDSLTNRFNLTAVNRANGGSMIQDSQVAGRVNTYPVLKTENYVLEASGNNITFSIPVNKYIRVYSNILSFLAVPNSRKIFPDSVTKVGTWDTGRFYGVPFVRSSTPGSYIQKVVVGRYVFIGSLMTTTGGNTDITVNGVAYGSMDGDMGTSMGSYTVAPIGYTIGPLAQDTNTIRITVAGSGNNRYFSWIYGIPAGEKISAPRLFSHPCIIRPVYTSSQDSLCVVYSAAMDSVNRVLQAAGIPLQSKSTTWLFPPNAYDTDSLHLSAIGASMVADSMQRLYENGTVQQAINQALNIDVAPTVPSDSTWYRTATGLGATVALRKNANSLGLTYCPSGTCLNEYQSYGSPATTIAVTYGGTAASPTRYGGTPLIPRRGALWEVFYPYDFPGLNLASGGYIANASTRTWANTALGSSWLFAFTDSSFRTARINVYMENGAVKASSNSFVAGTQDSIPNEYPASMGAAPNRPFHNFGMYYDRNVANWKYDRGAVRDSLDHGAGFIFNTRQNKLVFVSSGDTGTYQSVISRFDTGFSVTRTTLTTPYLYARDSAFAAKLTIMGATAAVLNMSRGSSSDNEHVHFQTLGVDKWLLGMNGSTEVFTLYNSSNALNALSVTTGGNLSIYGTIKTAAPTASTAVEWKFGTLVENTCILDAGAYATVEVGGVPRKVALCQ